MRCSSCGSENPDGKRFCADCGAALDSACPRCGSRNPAGKKYCGDCGAALVANVQSGAVQSPGATSTASNTITAEQTDASTAADGERKTVTALFADIKGSTELIRDLDPEDARAMVDPVLRLMIEAVHRYDGYVAQSTGDGIFALFGAPLAHEDHPQRALYAALAMQQGLRQHADRLQSEGRPLIQIRIGVNTGEVVVRTIETGGHPEYTPVGHTTNLAARMQTLAPTGGIVIGEDTRRLVEGYFELRALGPTEVKGVAQLVNVYEVLGAGPLRTHFELAAHRGLTRFVGREHELAELKRALELAQSGHGQIVAAVAEAGTGKSRLFHEFKAVLPTECKLLEAYSVSHDKSSAWLPVLEFLRGYFGIQDADDPVTRREKVRTRLAALDAGLGDVLPYLFALMSIQEPPDPLAQMDPQVKRQRTLEGLKRVILRESLNQPLVVVFEDLHWIDTETQSLLDLLVDSLANTRVLLLVNYRPEYRHNWSKRSYYSQLRLDPLGRESAEAMLSVLLSEEPGMGALKRLILERTEGNPFFIEEMVQALLDEGVLERNCTVKLARPAEQVRLPPTVQGVLASRIDRLPSEQKNLLQTLAVMGRESPLGLIRKVTSLAEGELARMLLDLQAGEFIYGQPAASGIEYSFKHVLTQEVAYNSLLREGRKHLHERVGSAVESLYAERLDDRFSELAYHYERSSNVPKALEYLQRAGQQAVQRSANVQAVAQFTRALELLKTLPDTPERVQREFDLQLAVSYPLAVTKGFASPEAEAACKRTLQLCGQIGETPQVIPVLLGAVSFYLFRAEFQTAQEFAERVISLAERTDDSEALLMAHRMLAEISHFRGEMVSARGHFEQAAALYGRCQSRSLIARFGFDLSVNTLAFLAHLLAVLGYPEQAEARGRAALALIDEIAHPLTTALTCGWLLEFQFDLRDVKALQRRAEALVGLCDEHGFVNHSGWGVLLCGWAIAMQGQVKEGIRQMQQCVAGVQKIKTELLVPYDLALLAEAYAKNGQTEDGLTALRQALDVVNRTGERWYDAELYRLQGQLTLQKLQVSGPGPQAENRSGSSVRSLESEVEEYFLKAIQIARSQSVKLFELRAEVSLARLLANQNRRGEARAMLAEIYGWFTEGFDTADLKDAKALLDELDA
jgi:class 3 adenylate cyclase/predicted ATPase